MDKIVGCIIEIGATQTFKRGWQKRHIVVDAGTSAAPNTIKIDCVNDTVMILDMLSVNEMVEVEVRIEGRKWESKYFVNLICESIQRIGDPIPAPDLTKEITDDELFKPEPMSDEDCPF